MYGVLQVVARRTLYFRRALASRQRQAPSRPSFASSSTALRATRSKGKTGRRAAGGSRSRQWRQAVQCLRRTSYTCMYVVLRTFTYVVHARVQDTRAHTSHSTSTHVYMYKYTPYAQWGVARGTYRRRTAYDGHTVGRRGKGENETRRQTKKRQTYDETSAFCPSSVRDRTPTEQQTKPPTPHRPAATQIWPYSVRGAHCCIGGRTFLHWAMAGMPQTKQKRRANHRGPRQAFPAPSTGHVQPPADCGRRWIGPSVLARICCGFAGCARKDQGAGIRVLVPVRAVVRVLVPSFPPKQPQRRPPHAAAADPPDATASCARAGTCTWRGGGTYLWGPRLGPTRSPHPTHHRPTRAIMKKELTSYAVLLR